MGIMEQVVETFIQNALWLDTLDEPAVAALRYAARALDEPGRPNGAVLAQYNAIYGRLMDKKPVEEPAPSELATFLQGAVLGGR